MSWVPLKLKFVGLFVIVEVILQLITRGIEWGSENHGFSFGLGQNVLPEVAYLVLVGCLSIWVIRQKEAEIGWWLIVAGGVANVASRMLLGFVWDYLHWSPGFDLWFNGADILILFGSLLVIVKEFRKEHG